jgi:imidazoleglycerol phosphate dehydratase HisB
VVRADEKIVIDLAFGDVRSKRIETPNDFVSHMIEHIAWRLGCSIDLQWPGDDCRLLGRMLGARIGSFTPVRQAAAAQGMLDDGSAEARIALGEAGGLEIRAAETVDLEWFLSLRCEQLPSGRLLVDLLTGLAEGLPAKLTVAVCNHEDTHHTWEGVFRAVGVALNKIYAPSLQAGTFSTAVETDPGTGDIMVMS